MSIGGSQVSLATCFERMKIPTHRRRAPSVDVPIIDVDEVVPPAAG